MNRLTGTIDKITSTDHLSQVEVAVSPGLRFDVLLWETSRTCSYLHLKGTVEILFKETEVILGSNLTGLLSVANLFPAQVKAVTWGEILTEVVLDSSGFEVVAIVPTSSGPGLDLREGLNLQWMVKASEVTLSEVTP